MLCLEFLKGFLVSNKPLLLLRTVTIHHPGQSSRLLLLHQSHSSIVCCGSYVVTEANVPHHFGQVLRCPLHHVEPDVRIDGYLVQLRLNVLKTGCGGYAVVCASSGSLL